MSQRLDSIIKGLAISLTLAGCNQSPPMTQLQKDTQRVDYYIRWVDRYPDTMQLKLADIHRSKKYPDIICGSRVLYGGAKMVFAIKADPQEEGSIAIGIPHHRDDPPDFSVYPSRIVDERCGPIDWTNFKDPYGFQKPKRL